MNTAKSKQQTKPAKLRFGQLVLLVMAAGSCSSSTPTSDALMATSDLGQTPPDSGSSQPPGCEPSGTYRLSWGEYTIVKGNKDAQVTLPEKSMLILRRLGNVALRLSDQHDGTTGVLTTNQAKLDYERCEVTTASVIDSHISVDWLGLTYRLQIEAGVSIQGTVLFNTPLADVEVALSGTFISNDAGADLPRYREISFGSPWKVGIQQDRTLKAIDGFVYVPEGAFTQVAVGGVSSSENHICALRSSEELACWNPSADALAMEVPKGTFRLLTRRCALDDAGKVSCWAGMNSSQDLFIDISTGGEVACGVTNSSTIECWSGFFAWPSDRGKPIAGYAKVVVNETGSAVCALTQEGVAHCRAGFDPLVVVDDGPFVELSVHQSHFCGRRSNGSVNCYRFEGCDGCPTTSPDPSERFTRIAVSTNESCGITLLGYLRCWVGTRDGL